MLTVILALEDQMFCTVNKHHASAGRLVLLHILVSVHDFYTCGNVRQVLNGVVCLFRQLPLDYFSQTCSEV